jgi:hypothetical protein
MKSLVDKMNWHHFECGNFSRSLVPLSKNNFYKNNAKILFYFSQFSMVDSYFFKTLKCQIHLVKSIQVNLSIEVKLPNFTGQRCQPGNSH